MISTNFNRANTLYHCVVLVSRFQILYAQALIITDHKRRATSVWNRLQHKKFVTLIDFVIEGSSVIYGPTLQRIQ